MKRVNYFYKNKASFKISYTPILEDTGLPIYPVTLGITEREIKVNWEPSKKHFIVFSTEGEGRVWLNGKWIPMPKGRVAYIPPNTPVIYEPVNENGWSTAYITFIGNSSDTLIGNEGCVFDDKLLAFIPEDIKMLMENFDDPDWEGRCFGALYHAIITLRGLKSERNGLHIPFKKNRSVLNKVHFSIQYINEHFSDDISLTFLAQKAGISEQYYCRIFKTLTETNPTNYINSLRISQACELFTLESERKIENIAVECGFHNISYFNKIFKQRTGMTPSAYKKKIIV